MKKHYEDKIKLFSALAGSLSVFSANTAEAQIVVRDINPDTAVNVLHSNYDLDIDNDGTTDFFVNKWTDNTYSSFYFNGSAYSSAGENHAQTLSTKQYAIAELNLGDTTSFMSVYNNNRYATLLGASGTPQVPWDGYQWTAGATDKYVGVQFAIGNVMHYGWIQVSVASDYSYIKISKVAYESSPGALMKAGALVSANALASVTIDDHGNSADASDIRITIPKAANESNITTYRAYVVPASKITHATLDSLQNMAAGNYQDIPKTGNSYTATLSPSLKDIYGNAIVEGTPYKVIVESVGNSTTGDALSPSSNTLTLSTIAVTTGVSAQNTISGRIYSSGSTVYLTDIEKNCNISILSVTGTEIYHGSVNAGNSNVILSGETSGVYVVRLTAGDGTSAVQKVLLQN
jgi:hypothetical protein